MHFLRAIASQVSGLPGQERSILVHIAIAPGDAFYCYIRKICLILPHRRRGSFKLIRPRLPRPMVCGFFFATCESGKFKSWKCGRIGKCILKKKHGILLYEKKVALSTVTDHGWVAIDPKVGQVSLFPQARFVYLIYWRPSRDPE